MKNVDGRGGTDVVIRMSIVYPAVVVPLLAVDASLLDSASAGNRARLPRTDDPPKIRRNPILISLFRYFIFVQQTTQMHNFSQSRQYFKWDKGPRWAQPSNQYPKKNDFSR